jgi:hypothetical protein
MNIANTHPRHRFWLELAAATMFAVVTVFTLELPDWIEELSGFSPDSGNGSTEWALVAVLGGATVGISWLTAREWRGGSIARATHRRSAESRT